MADLIFLHFSQNVMQSAASMREYVTLVTGGLPSQLACCTDFEGLSPASKQKAQQKAAAIDTKSHSWGLIWLQNLSH